VEEAMRRVVLGLIAVSIGMWISVGAGGVLAQAHAAKTGRAAAVPICAVEKSARATGGGETLDTAAIQAAIDECEAKGGGIVRLAGAASFVSAPLLLKSHITLEIAAGTTLEGSPDHADYPEIEEFHDKGRLSLLSAHNAEDITIRGGGVIDGNGASWWTDPHQTRPRLIVFDHCKHILMENITVQNSPMWQIVPYDSEDVTFRNMKVLAPEPAGHNTDGIDPFSSKHVVIDHVLIDTGDDDVAIKSGEPGSAGPDDPTVDVTITDCTFLKGHGLSVGSEVAGGVQHVRAERVTFNGTTQGIRIKSGRDRGADIGDFVYKDITMQNVGTAIQITDYYGGGATKAGAAAVSPAAVTRLTPHIHDITIEDLKVTGAKVAMDIEGLPEAPIENVVLKNVQIEAVKGAKIYYANVVSHGVVIHAQSGPPVVTGAGATGSLK
jgi:polygalacturonase